MVNSAKRFVCCVKERQVVGIDGHVAMNEFDRGVRSVQFFLKGLSWIVEDVAEEDMSSCVVEKAHDIGTNAYGTLGGC